jgi:hypothetical protein
MEFSPLPQVRPPLSKSHTGLLIGLGAAALAVVAIIVVVVIVWNLNTNTGPARPPLKVSTTETGENVYATIQAAVEKAKPGDVIELWDDRYEENVIVDPQRPNTATNLTLRAAEGKQIVWTFKKGNADRPLLQLTKAKDFKLQGDGILMDGQGQSKRLILASYQSPGLEIRNLRVTAFKDQAVVFFGCQGEGAPVLLDGMQVVGSTSGSKAVIYFDANSNSPMPFNDYIHVKNCRFGDMPLAQAIQRRDNTVTGGNLVLPQFEWNNPLPQLPPKGTPKPPTKKTK